METTSLENEKQSSHEKIGDYEKECLELYRKHWSREEQIEGLDLSHDWTEASMLKRIEDIQKEHPKLIRRKFQNVLETDTEHSSTLSVMTWNILAQALSIGKDNFTKCPTDALDWKYRRLLILEEIIRVSPDVACLQEVDHYGLMNQVLTKIGYEGCFFPKPDSPALYTENSNGPDGCAIFYKTSKLTLLENELIVLKNVLNNRRTNQVCILQKLQIKDGGKIVYVGTTHLKAKLGDRNVNIRQNQGTWLLEHLNKSVGEMPLIFCGDFNAESTEPVYISFAKSRQNLYSTYRHLDKEGKEPPFTTWKIRDKEVCHTIDYMWYTKDCIKPIAILELPTEYQIGKNRLPYFHYPSDHVSLAAEYIL